MKNNSICMKLSLPAGKVPCATPRELGALLLSHHTTADSLWINRLSTIIDELVNNAAQHGSKTLEDEILIEFVVEENTFHLSVTDAGKGSKEHKANFIKSFVEERQHVLADNPVANVGLRGRGLAQMICKWIPEEERKIIDNDNGGITIKVSKKFEETKK